MTGASAYPGAYDLDATFRRVVGTDALVPGDHNNLVDAVESIEAAVGLLPAVGWPAYGGGGAKTVYDAVAALVAAGVPGLVKIAEQVLGAGAGSVSFLAVPQTYRSLRLVAQARGDSAVNDITVQVRLNNDSGANYDTQLLLAAAATASGSETLGGTSGGIGNVPGASATAGRAGSLDVIIPNYAGAVFDKEMVGHSGYFFGTGSGAGRMITTAVNWRSTAAITRVDLLASAGNFIAGSVFTLYGLV